MSTALVQLGAFLVDADVIAREVVQPGTHGLRAVVEAFGEEYLQADGQLNRERLGQYIFQHKTARLQLNGIVHPLVREEMWRQAHHYVKQDASRIAILDVPLLIEGGTHRLVDVTVLVFAPQHAQLYRLMKRNGFDEEEAQRRIAAQLSMEEKRAQSDVIVDNSGNESEVTRLACELYEYLKNLARDGARSDGTFDRSVVRPFVIQ